MIKTSFESCKKMIPTLIGLYIAMFWIADARYTNAVSRLEARTTNLVTRLESEQWRKAIELLPHLQNRKIPMKPSFFCPIDVVFSLMPSRDEVDLEIVEELQDIVIAKKNDLNRLNLYNLVIQSKSYNNTPMFQCEQAINTPYIDLSLASIKNSMLDFAEFNYTNFTKADLSESTLTNSTIRNTTFDKANLSKVSFNKAVFHNVSFKNTNLGEANLIGADMSSTECLNEATLKGATYNSTNIGCNDHSEFDQLEILCKGTASLSEGTKKYCSRSINILKSMFCRPPTKFPEGFNPKAHGMIDLSEILVKTKDN